VGPQAESRAPPRPAFCFFPLLQLVFFGFSRKSTPTPNFFQEPPPGPPGKNQPGSVVTGAFRSGFARIGWTTLGQPGRGGLVVGRPKFVRSPRGYMYAAIKKHLPDASAPLRKEFSLLVHRGNPFGPNTTRRSVNVNGTPPRPKGPPPFSRVTQAPNQSPPLTLNSFLVFRNSQIAQALWVFGKWCPNPPHFGNRIN